MSPNIFAHRTYIAHRQWQRGSPSRWYVAQTPGNGGKDWGYTEDFNKAARLTAYWARRFRADCWRVGYTASFIEM